jgi:hypothetical protein
MESKQANELYQKLVTKSWEDQNFLAQLLKHPVPTIEKELGRPLKLQNRKVTVEDQTDTKIIYFNIPREPNFEDVELSEHQLELIAGGNGIKIIKPVNGFEGL